MPVALLRFAGLAALTSLVAAQSQQQPTVRGYGQYPCTSFDANNNPIANHDACTTLTNPDGYASPTDAKCVLEPQTGFYFCGIKGAACTTNSNCDYGSCQDSKCFGGLGDVSPGDSFGCLGLAYINDDGVCGGIGSLCNYDSDFDGRGTSSRIAYDTLCASDFCGANGCHAAVNPGDACLTDDSRICGPSLYAWRNHATGACTCEATPPPAASQRARTRRALGSLCPASHTACALGTGFECIDTQTNLERCGGCNEESGGIDCTALPDVEAVGCVDGQCEIRACADGHTYDSDSAVCRKE